MIVAFRYFNVKPMEMFKFSCFTYMFLAKNLRKKTDTIPNLKSYIFSIHSVMLKLIAQHKNFF